MPHLVSNLVEKGYTQSTAKLAPRHLWNRPVLGRRPEKVGRLGADPTWKAMWRFIRSWVCHNHKMYYTFVVMSALGMYSFWWYACVGYYRQRNSHRSLEYAIQLEKEWDLIKPKDDDDDDEEEEE